LDQNFYRNLVSGANDSFAKRLLRLLLGIVSVAYQTVVALRNFCYDKQLLRSYRADAPVISVGNITTGGTGKTPLVIWLCNQLKAKSVSCAVLTRGYKAQSGKFADEPAILAKSCPAAKIIVNPDRVSAANKAVSQFNAKVLVMDDGFQHRRLRRDLDIVAIDATCPFGYGRMLPAGLLREPAKVLLRADAAVITRYDQVTARQVEQLEKAIEQIAPGITIAKAVHKHPCARMLKDEILGIAQLKEKTIFAFCGVGNPDAFLNRLREFALNVIGSKVYNDHHDYSQADITNIYEEAKNLGADLILSTQKDWVKTALLSQQNDDILFAYLAVELEFIDGADKIEALVDKAIAKRLDD
jgi:tetraacyldisaccharide 4'-kinase